METFYTFWRLINLFQYYDKPENLDIYNTPYSTIDKYSNKIWYINGECHREYGPAVEYINGTKAWYINGELHREYGPAVIYSDGHKEWYLNGYIYNEEEYNKKIKDL